jgi:hypothetical protein
MKKEIDKNLIDEQKQKQISTLNNLIQKNLDRLELAIEVEKEKKFIFPETTSICKIIMQMQENINILNGVVIKDNKKKTDNDINDLKLELDLEI